jgi:hypothetical protein
VTRTNENMSTITITFTPSEINELNSLVNDFEVKGGRYPADHAMLNWG